MTNLSLYLTESADMYPGAAALRCEEVTTTYSELADQAARFAAYLCTHDVRPGDRVGIMLGNRPEFAAAFFGILHAGAVVVLLDPPQSWREVQVGANEYRCAAVVLRGQLCARCNGGCAGRRRVADRTRLPRAGRPGGRFRRAASAGQSRRR